MKHYAGQVFAWDVVDEALDQSSEGKPSPGYNHPGIRLAPKGSAYVEPAFRWAHQADPQALPFYQKAEGEGWNRKSDALYGRAKDFKRRSVPIDGVGFELHVSPLDWDSAAFAAKVAPLTALGVQVHITELDGSLPLYAPSEPLEPPIAGAQDRHARPIFMLG
jgi:endo-1,4-beta-xylanase